MRSCTRMRLAHTQSALRYLDAIAPLIAISISVSSKDNERRVAAQFHRGLLDRGGVRHQQQTSQSAVIGLLGVAGPRSRIPAFRDSPRCSKEQTTVADRASLF